MDGIKSLMKRHPLVTYFVLAYALTWALEPLLNISLALGVFGLLMPAVAAIVITTITEGKSAVKTLLGRLKIWRVGLVWHVIALGLPVVLSIGVMALSIVLGTPSQVELSPISPLTLIVFVLVVGEEIGWRGYALPKLLQNHSALTASLILGALWGAWHLPTFFIAGTPQAGVPFIAFLFYTTGLSMLFTWLYLHTQGSLLLATLFHGAIDSFGFVNNALDPVTRWWLIGIVYMAAGLLVFIIAGLNLGRQPAAQGATPSTQETTTVS
jgi:membrane protease YdiL (CAAX protease family)